MRDREALESFVRRLPKAELHVHLEGTLEPELALTIAERNGISPPFPSIEAAKAAYRFENLQSFLDVYYATTAVLRTEQDFYDLAWAYLTRAAEQNVRHVEPFFDPQAHLARGVPFGIFIAGILLALEDAEAQLGITSRLIMCFLRDHSVEDARKTLATAHLYRHRIAGVGLDSAEAGYPPELFRDVFAEAAAYGMHRVAHAGEEGPPEYVAAALDLLGAERIDHGVRSLEDPALVERLARERVPLTVCPLSNVKLRVVPSLEQHPLKRMLDAGLLVTVNSDDPAYFGGYLVENYVVAALALDLSRDEIVTLAENSFVASFLDESAKAAHVEAVRAAAALP
ncbi:adenosine deaminase [Coriobacteriia bacterium Es71-Z0120]|uniref:adenosine deaminase n=1 Tax=Parvivirga hydrogeniphila TaxID=2939460 RepID=UPI0022610463|nr:adenosine deaminase [Parvivirga hydrogeniphila]MCL4078841.1 adenosine deaminase [Parvivirga hydrogeniphila]